MLKIHATWSRKCGEANYGSRGASVSLEVEADTGLVREPDKLQAKLDYLFDLAKKSVDVQLNSEGRAEQTSAGGDHDGHGDTNGNGRNGSNGSRRTNGRQATASQVRAIHAIANRRRLDLTTELRDRFGVDRPDDLGIGEASEFIDAIKSATSGNGGRR